MEKLPACGDIKPESESATNIILNHDFSQGLHHWHHNACHAYVVSHETPYPQHLSSSLSGRFVVVTNRQMYWHGLEQDITNTLSAGLTYTVCAWVAVSKLQGATDVIATLKYEHPDSSLSFQFIGKISASTDHWGKLEGTFSLSRIPRRLLIYLEGPSPGIDLLIKSVTVSCNSLGLCDSRRVGGILDADNIIQNPSFGEGLNNWEGRGCKIVLHESMADGRILPMTGKVFVSTADRTNYWNGIQQEITGRVQRRATYELTAFVRIFGNNKTTAGVKSTLWFQAPDLREWYIGVAHVQATDKEWVQLQGSFFMNVSSARVVIYLEGPPPGTDILLNTLVVKQAAKVLPASPPFIEGSNTTERRSTRNTDMNLQSEMPDGSNIILNHDFSEGIHQWHPNSCKAYVVEETAQPEQLSYKLSGRFAVVTNRSDYWHCVEQDITSRVSAGPTYTVRAWVAVSKLQGATDVVATLKLVYEFGSLHFQFVGKTSASTERWAKLEGSFRLARMPGRVIFYLEGPSPGIDLLIRSVLISCNS